MTKLFMLPHAAADLCAGRARPTTRQEILVRLLNKRAEAHRQGLHREEQLLREQIRWALPVNEFEDA